MFQRCLLPSKAGPSCLSSSEEEDASAEDSHFLLSAGMLQPSRYLQESRNPFVHRLAHTPKSPEQWLKGN